MGVLHPVQPGASGIDPASTSRAENADSALFDDQEEEATEDEESEGQTPAQPARRRRYVPPSSVGFSCFVRGEPRLWITASAARYEGTEDRDETGQFQQQGYDRTRFDEHAFVWPIASGQRESIWEGRAGIDVRARPHREGTILTVTLFNQSKIDGNASGRKRAQDRIEKSLFEARLECAIESGELLEYPRVDPSLLTEEEQELELQYRERRIYAIGHGAAVDWQVEPGSSARIWSEFMPATETPIMAVDAGSHGGVLKLDRLATTSAHDELADFADGYAEWITNQKRAAAEAEGSSQAAAKRICDRMAVALARMRSSIEMLRADPIADESFRLANRAMLEQMRQADRVAGKETEPGDYRWRPFQLAFLLTVLESTVREDDGFRDVLDLIWFPTGGGKTEAYLGLIAFLIVWRRLKHPGSGGGTVALMRYTLRLLARQQFERAARMVCALELIRRENPDRLGEEPIDVGIWVGKVISPNRFDQAREIVGEIASGKTSAQHGLLLERCPWCNTPFDAVRGYRATERDFRFLCTNGDCTFDADSDIRPLPCNVVDEALYKHPPSLLIGTIDKFARMAWEERTGAFFGTGRGSRPPELVIQDELHLITGPLGSVTGLYEAGLDTMLVQRGARPKYIASTATIRMAKEQAQRLYARDLAVFPPPGLSCDDSYFARRDRQRPGRLYVGYLAPMLDQQHCLAPLAAALLTGPPTAFKDDMSEADLLEAWWTLVIYHGSLKGVGNSHNAFVTDVRDFGRRIAGELRQKRPLGGADAADGECNAAAEEFRSEIAQLTSMRTAQENAETFQRLAKSRGEKDCLDAVLATNMVSVGLDVARLALMVVNGQPLTTAEYIQASSRVGRADVPGLVFANYYRHQARSLSHYESFRPYHESFYRFVEPSSVTPYTYQVRSRALHAALVIAIRHACADLRGNTRAGEFDKEVGKVKDVVAELKARCGRADPAQAEATAQHIERLVQQWHDEARRCEMDRRQLSYQAPNREKNADRLLYGHGESRPGLWPTLHSMRNVESEGVLKLRD